MGSPQGPALQWLASRSLPKVFRVRLFPTAPVAAAALSLSLITACGSSGPSGGATTGTPPAASTSAGNAAHKPLNKPEDLKVLDGITVTGDDPAKAPTVKIDKLPVSVSATAVRVLKEGTGEESSAKSRVTVKSALFLGKDGKQLDSDYEKSGSQSFVLSSDQTIPGLNTALTGVKSGSRILFAIPPVDAFGSAGQTAAGIGPTDNLVVVADVQSVGTPLAAAEGTPVAPVAGQPTVTFDPKTGPAITVPKTPAPTALVSQLLVEGKGAPVKDGQSITVHYTGVVYATGTKFDSSWDKGSPFTFTLGAQAVIPGWDKGLVGKKVGSRVLLVVPPEDGYKDKANGQIPASSTLVFVVDILDAG